MQIIAQMIPAIRGVKFYAVSLLTGVCKQREKEGSNFQKQQCLYMKSLFTSFFNLINIYEVNWIKAEGQRMLPYFVIMQILFEQILR